jgi:D-alanyl-D-alanine carboxypeptidase/D-alanyl-D-alanine-endopeptidase (penicillin-binding protein 4)
VRGLRSIFSGVQVFRLALVLCGVLITGVTQASNPPMPPEVAQAWAKTGLPASSLSLVIEQVQGPRIAGVGANEAKNPASVMKLVTTWAALSELGPDFVWRTAFLIDKGAQIDAQGRLTGPVYLRPTGDPLFLLEDLWRLMRELRLRGIREIPEIVIDRSRFADVAIDPSSFDGKGDRPYNASPDVFMVGFGSVRLVFTPALEQQQWRAFIDPPIPGIDIDSNIRFVPGACKTAPQISTETIAAGDQVRFRITGQASGACGEFDLYRLAFSQEEYASRALRTMWQELGGTLKGDIRNGIIPADAVPVAAHESPPLAEVIRVINKRSNNVMTRVLLLTIGAEMGQKPATVAGSVQAVKNILQAQGISMSDVVIENGSGLSRIESISADRMAQMLQVAWRSPAMPEYLSSMAILGVDGTLRRRLGRNATRGYANMKTGALRDSRAIAGYVLSTSGKRYIFVSLVNHPEAFKARDFENAVMNWLIQKP